MRAQETDDGVDAEARETERPSHCLGVKRLASGELFGSANEVEIVHGGAVYRLRVTRQGKLILNK